MSGAQPEWDDARLNAAFAARADAQRTTPPDLIVSIRARASVARHPVAGIRRFAPLVGLAAALAIAVVVGSGQLGGLMSPAASSSPNAADAQAMIGHPITVRQAVAIRDAGRDDREIAVSGFLARYSTPVFCPDVIRPQNPARLGCPGSFAWLLDVPEVLETTSGNTTITHVPTGPSIQPSFALVGEPAGADPSNASAVPVPMTVVGHFDDRRAALCEGDTIDACRDSFVVDRLVTGGDLAVPSTTVAEGAPSPKMSAADVDDVIRQIAPEVRVLARRVVAGTQVVALEPALAGDTWYSGFPVVWVVTGLAMSDGVPVARTYLLIDGAADVVEMTPDGPITHEFPRPTAQPTPSPAPSDAGVIGSLLTHPITVSQAIDRRDTNLDDTELAVDGFSWSTSAALDCLVDSTTPAPFRGCERRYTWLAETADTRPNPISPDPAGPAFNLFVQPETIGAALVGPEPTHVIALGHFDDHRASACPAEQTEQCRKNFVVDAIVDVAKRQIVPPLMTVDPNAGILTPIDLAIRMAGLDPGDPALVAAFAIQTRVLAQFEPGAVGAPELDGNSVWIIRWVDAAGRSRPVVRTRIVTDEEPDHRGIGSYEVDGSGIRPVLPAPALTDPSDPLSAAPSTILGLNVMDVATALEREPLLSRAEIAVRGWYMPPAPNATCPGRDPLIHTIEPPCDAARHWLLQGPEQLWTDPGTADPRPSGPFLNPILPSDVRFSDLADPWADGSPNPVPVILVGHFEDTRTQTRSGSQSLVVDALVWQPGGATQQANSLTRLTDEPAEDPTAILETIDSVLGSAAEEWTSVVRTADFPILDEHTSQDRPELLHGRVLWIVRRLVPDPHARDQLVVDTAYMVDGSRQVWLKPANEHVDLATTLDVGPFGANTRIVQVYDYSDLIASVRPATGADQLTWQRINPGRDGIVQIARGASDREVAIRWTGGACDLHWRLLVSLEPTSPNPGPWIQPMTFDGYCPANQVTRAVVLTFKDPVDLRALRSMVPDPNGNTG